MIKSHNGYVWTKAGAVWIRFRHARIVPMLLATAFMLALFLVFAFGGVKALMSGVWR